MKKTYALRAVTGSIIILLGFLIQTSICSTLLGLYSIPNILLFITVGYALMYGTYGGIIVGIACGLLMDIFCGDIIGFYILIYALFGCACGLLHRFLNEQEVALPVITTTICDLIYGVIIYITRFMLKGDFRFGLYLNKVILPEALFTAIAAVVLYWIMLRIFNAVKRFEKRSSRKFG